MTSLRIALFADSAPQFLVRALQAQATSLGAPCEVQSYAFTSPLAVQEELAAFQPDVVLLWRCAEAVTDAPAEPLEPILELPYTFIAYTMVSRDDGAYGSCALTQERSLRKRLLRFNLHLAEPAVAGGERKEKRRNKQKNNNFLHHPFVPPLETPDIILRLKMRKITISGTEIATTAAIIAGTLSRPKPFSRIA